MIKNIKLYLLKNTKININYKEKKKLCQVKK